MFFGHRDSGKLSHDAFTAKTALENTLLPHIPYDAQLFLELARYTDDELNIIMRTPMIAEARTAAAEKYFARCLGILGISDSDAIEKGGALIKKLSKETVR